MRPGASADCPANEKDGCTPPRRRAIHVNARARVTADESLMAGRPLTMAPGSRFAVVSSQALARRP